MGAPDAHGTVAEPPDGALESVHSRLGLVLGVDVEGVADSARVGPQQVVDETDGEGHCGEHTRSHAADPERASHVSVVRAG